MARLGMRHLHKFGNGPETKMLLRVRFGRAEVRLKQNYRGPVWNGT